MAAIFPRFVNPARSLCALTALIIGMQAVVHAQDAPPVAANSNDNASAEQIAFSADKLDYETATDTVTASGNVIASRDGYTLRADTIVWDRRSGKVTASGNIRSVGPEGDVAYGDSIEVTDSLRDGIVQNLLLVLNDGSRLAANRGTRSADGTLVLNNAAYTPCSVERPDGCPKEPSWQVKAVRVVYDPVKKRVRYTGARIELFGLPIIPLPGLSHPAETEAGSGFVVPNISFSRNNGLEIEQGYYWRLAPNRDFLLSGHVFSDVAPMAQARYRAWEDKGAFQITGYATYSNRVPTAGGPAVGSDRFRGYLEGGGKFQFNPNWSASASVRLATDRTFLRRYDISRDDRLRNNLNIERIDDDSYFSFNGWGVQTLRSGDRQGLQPIALPEVDYRRRLTDPWLGGKIQLQANSLLIGRTSGQDTQRAFASARWDLRTLTNLGQEVNFTLMSRGDVYHSDENATTITPIYRGLSGWQARGSATAATDLRWPFVGEAFGGTQILTPRIQLVTTYTSSNLRMPNEDARAVDLEDSNLFALNRFPGYDRIEDNARITYGFDYSIRTAKSTFDFTIGQSYRLSNKPGIFPDGTGLSNKVSDIVGRSEFRFRDFVKLTHRFRLDKDNFAIRRNEVDATVGSRSTYVQVGYLRLDRNIGPTLEDLQDREEIRLAGRVRLARYWSLFGSTIIDLSDANEDPLLVADGYEPIRHRLGIAYDDDCLSIGITWRRDYQPTGDARRGNSFLFRLAFRNLGV
ncbi:MAG: LPS-assembly protein LptD [Sphingorhabdus sp.]